MHDGKGVRIEVLGDVLVKVSGWGVEPNRIATNRVLRELVGVDPSLPRKTAGGVIIRYLEVSISRMESREFLGRRYEARVMQGAYLDELGYGWKPGQAEARQYQAMLKLGLNYSYDHWRKTAWLKRAFFVILAEHLVAEAVVQAA